MTRSRCAPHRGPFVRLSVCLVSGILVSLFSGSATLQASLVWSADPANYGYLWQYSVAPPIGAEACGPTSTTNAFTYLQNTQGSHLGNVLTGNDYDSWRATAETLASGQYMKTEGSDKPQAEQGTTYGHLATGMQQYAQDRGAKIQFNGMMSDKVPPNGDLPPWVKRQDKGPTIDQLYNMLAGGAGVVMGMNPGPVGGHIVTLAGMNWKDNNGNGIVDRDEKAKLFVIDPLDPSSNVHNKNQGEPYGSNELTPQRAMFTELHVWQDEYQGDPFLVIDYWQYHGSYDESTMKPEDPYTPYDGNYQRTDLYITGAFSMRAVPEPTSVLVWSSLVLGVTLTRRRRMA